MLEQTVLGSSVVLLVVVEVFVNVVLALSLEDY